MARLIVILIITLILFLFYIRFLEQRSLYFPLSEITQTPDQYGLKYEDIMFETEDKVSVNGWIVPSPDSRITVIFCHGNGGNISHRMDKVLFFRSLNVNQLIFDYRGYGKSEGHPSEEGLYRDARAAYDLAKKRFPKTRIIVFGESLGGAVAVELALGRDVRGVILEDTFTSVREMCKEVFPLLPKLIIRDQYNTARKIGKLKVPVFIMHSPEDEIVPYAMGRKLFQAASEPKEFLALNGPHNEAFFLSQERIRARLKEFFDKPE